MSDRLVVMDRGRVRQTGTPQDLYERPDNLFVAGFLGRCNVFTGHPGSPGVFRVGPLALPCGAEAPAGDCALVVRPERVNILPAGGVLPGRIGMVTYLGGMTDWHVETDAGLILVTRPTPDEHDPLRRLAAGDVVGLDWAANAGRLLPTETDGGP